MKYLKTISKYIKPVSIALLFVATIVFSSFKSSQKQVGNVNIEIENQENLRFVDSAWVMRYIDDLNFDGLSKPLILDFNSREIEQKLKTESSIQSAEVF